MIEMDKIDTMLLILFTFVAILLTLLILDIRRELMSLGYWQDYTLWEKIKITISCLIQLTVEPYDKAILKKPKKSKGDEE